MRHARTIAMATTLLADGRAEDVVDMVTPLLDAVTAPAASTGQILLRGLMARVEVTHHDRFDRAFELLPARDDVSDACTCVRGDIALWRGWAHVRRSATNGEAARGLRLTKESEELFRSICDPVGRCWALLGQAQAYATLEEHGLARRVLDDMTGLLHRLHDTPATRWWHELRISAFRRAGKYDRAGEHLDALRSIAEDWEDRHLQGHVAAHTAALRYDREDPPPAIIEDASAAASLLRRGGRDATASLLRATRAHIGALCRQAAWTEALGRIDKAAGHLPDRSTVESFLETLRVHVALRRGNAEHALSMLDDEFDRNLPASPLLCRPRVALLYAEAFMGEGRSDEAATWFRRAHRMARESGHDVYRERAARGLAAQSNQAHPRVSERSPSDDAEPPSSPVDPTSVVGGFVAESREMQTVANTIRHIQPSHSPVLITGEGGAGKRLAARAIHATSVRAQGPLKTVSCDPTQTGVSLETRLFGTSEDGMARPGALRSAHEGTLLIEDIDALPSSLQTTLLRLIDTGECPPVDGTRDAPVDVRLIATTTADLDTRAHEGRFEQALYDRLQGVTLHVPPLRERRPDIPLLARHFLNELRPEGSSLVSITQPAMEALLRYNWPGNVRQLRNEIERALVHVQSEPAPTIDLDTLNDAIVEGAKQTRSSQTQEEALDAILEPDQTLNDVLSRTEKAVIERVLQACDGQVTASADVLGLSRQGLYKKMKRLDIDASSFQSSEPTPTT